jgi:glycosyltransferase involved in cell wall biosynthesis
MHSAQKARTLIAQGWLFLPHSYALVNQWQLLALSRRTDVAVKIMHAPFYRQSWQGQEDLFGARAEETLRSLLTAERDERADVLLRIFAPFDFSLSRSRRTAVFGTSESQTVLRNQVRDFSALERLKQGQLSGDLMVVTPSRWSAEGFYKAGFKTEQVVIVPHGVDVDTFQPMPHRRREVRPQISVAEDDFVFVSVGAMTGNKGVDVLLQAFAEVTRKFPFVHLVLKGIDPLYDSKDRLLKAMQAVAPEDQQRVSDRLHYFGKSFSNEEMATLYQAADAYVSPYRAEGFNLPVLEAAACGLPVICTAGGATDDFVTEAFAHRIESTKLSHKVGDQELWRVEPSLEHLVALMSSAVEDHAWRRAAAEAGPRHVRASYTWDSVVDLLVQRLFD